MMKPEVRQWQEEVLAGRVGVEVFCSVMSKREIRRFRLASLGNGIGSSFEYTSKLSYSPRDIVLPDTITNEGLSWYRDNCARVQVKRIAPEQVFLTCYAINRHLKPSAASIEGAGLVNGTSLVCIGGRSDFSVCY